jgi:hypothetical protein
MAVEIITTVLVSATATPPAGPYDLTDLATVHDELTIPTADVSNDSFLSRAITQVSASIAKYCNRVFQVESLQDLIYLQQDPYPYQVPGGVESLQLSRWPMVNATVTSFTGNTHGTTTVDGIVSTAGLIAGQLVFAADGSVPGGTTITSIGANSITLSKAATSTETALSFNTGVQVIQNLGSGQTQTLVYGQDYTIDPTRGWLIRLNSFTAVAVNWEAIPLTVQYQAGYSSIPDDLVDAALRLVTARFRAKGRDPMLVERTQPGPIGMERWWVGNAPGQTGVFAPEIEALIEQYRVPVVS